MIIASTNPNRIHLLESVKIHNMKLVIQVVIVALALLLAAYIIPGIDVSSFFIALIAAIVIGLLNLIVRPILFVLTLPLTIVTFGLFAFVLNALMFLFAAYFVDGFTVSGFIPALLGSLLVSIASTLGDRMT